MHSSSPCARRSRHRARKARASLSAACSVGASERWRMRSSRSPCCPVAESLHLPATPGPERRTNKRPAPWRRLGHQRSSTVPACGPVAGNGGIPLRRTRRARLRCRSRSWGGASGEGAHGGARNMISKHRGTSLLMAGTPGNRPCSGSCRRRTARRPRAKRGRAAGRSAAGSGATAKRMGRRGEAPARVEGGS